MARSVTALSNIAVSLFAAGVVPSTAPLYSAPVHTTKAACERVKTRVSAAKHLPGSMVAFCDPVWAADGPRGFYVLALHSNRRCDGICSTNMGWFAVEKKTGRVLEWDVAEMKLGQPIKSDR